jgi:cellulose synthase/poly-beta-1,6-N-acetylglucosamine synthase-like glycosyltransferase
MILFETIFLLLAVLLFIPVLVLAAQILVALPNGSRSSGKEEMTGVRPSIAVLVPAHNEAAGIAVTLDALRAQLGANDRLLVVADNCTDNTATVARACGAEVYERHDEQLVGKSYALDYGVRHLESSPPEVLVVIDADCHVHADALSYLTGKCLAYGRPAQALYLMHSPDGAGLKTRIAEFAWHVKNWARPLGYQRMGLPCHLMGTGMAFPWSLIRQANIASGHIVEDLKLGLDLAREGYAPVFCPEARVTSVFPVSREGIESQRTRWEHGHLHMMVKDGPGYFIQGFAGMNTGLMALVADMVVPPLALLTLLTAILFLLGGILSWITGAAWPWMLSGISFAVLGTTVLLAWAKFGRSMLSFRQLAYAPVYALAKLPLYLKFLVKRQAVWVRSKRDADKDIQADNRPDIEQRDVERPI